MYIRDVWGDTKIHRLSTLTQNLGFFLVNISMPKVMKFFTKTAEVLQNMDFDACDRQPVNTKILVH
jgi:hypothetical protein